MNEFRYAIFGAGNIANRFCRAVGESDGCTVCAVASKTRSKAEAFAKNNDIPAFYDSYAALLEQEKPDCVYIATTPDSHFPLTMLCLNAKIPVLCEKAMFVTGAEAKAAFAKSEADGVFCMEALWSRFLPANVQAKRWISEGRIGKVSYLEVSIGFVPNQDPEARYLSPKLAGGATTDLTCYAYELARYYLDKTPTGADVRAIPSATGVDLTDDITLRYDDMTAHLITTFAAPLNERAVIYGDRGRIEVPHPHFASEAILYEGRTEKERFSAGNAPDGFTYEIREAMRCIREGKAESPVVPHALTQDCADLFDRVYRAAGLHR